MFIVQDFSGNDLSVCETLEEAREIARRCLGVAQLTPDLEGGCPDHEDAGLAGVECWCPPATGNEYADAEAAVFIMRPIA